MHTQARTFYLEQKQNMKIDPIIFLIYKNASLV